MWMLVLAGCFREPYPAAFDWAIDRTRVAGISIWPKDGDFTVARRIDALVLSPHAVREVHVEVCGLRTDAPVYLGFDASCYAEPALRERIADDLPATWVPPELAFACATSTEGPTEGSGHPEGGMTADTGVILNPPCASTIPVRVFARSDADRASSAVVVSVSAEPWDPRAFEPDPATAAPALEVVEGEPEAGGEVLLGFSVAEGWPETVQWYADAGVFHGTGRTGITRREGGRQISENRLAIPAGARGPLRVAAVAGGSVWAVIALEVR